MNNKVFAALLPAFVLLSACSTVDPVIKDNGARQGPCVDGGPDSVARAFYDLRTEQPSQGLPDTQRLAKYRPYLSDKLYQSLISASTDKQKSSQLRSGDLFSSLAQGPDDASVADASTIPNRDARNIPLRVDLRRDGKKWQDEVLMVREGSCWVVDDIRYLGNPAHPGGSLGQALEK